MLTKIDNPDRVAVPGDFWVTGALVKRIAYPEAHADRASRHGVAIGAATTQTRVAGRVARGAISLGRCAVDGSEEADDEGSLVLGVVIGASVLALVVAGAVVGVALYASRPAGVDDVRVSVSGPRPFAVTP